MAGKVLVVDDEKVIRHLRLDKQILVKAREVL